MQNSLWNVHTYLYCRKVKSVTEILLISLFLYLFLFLFFHFSFFFFYSLWLIVLLSPLWSPHVCLVSVFGLFTSIGLACRNFFKIMIHSCLEMLGMYGVTWFPLKSYIRTKSKWVKKKKKTQEEEEEIQIKPRGLKTKKKMLLCILILNWKKRLIILDQVCKACSHVSRLMSFNAF